MSKTIFVTGGAGFIGSALIRLLFSSTSYTIVNIDKLTYAANLSALSGVELGVRYHFSQTDICDRASLDALFAKFKPAAVIHLAAESHVDRSITGSADFIQTNIVGTYTLLEASRAYWLTLSSKKQQQFRFHHVSTDEVYGDLDDSDGYFTESSAYAPSSPYSASKAASDHLVRAWYRTYGLPVLITNCSNNYGPYQHTEKLIPLMITRALAGQPLPIYGDGLQVRDWLYVDDHATALLAVLERGALGETYNIGGHNEIKNIDVVLEICEMLDSISPMHNRGYTLGSKHASLIKHVTDRPGHDVRYAIDASKIQRELGWKPQETFSSGLFKTIKWYLDNITK